MVNCCTMRFIIIFAAYSLFSRSLSAVFEQKNSTNINQQEHYLEEGSAILSILADYLQQHQNIPTFECTSRRLLVMSFHPNRHDGVGAHLMELSNSLAIAVHSNRILIWGSDVPILLSESSSIENEESIPSWRGIYMGNCHESESSVIRTNLWSCFMDPISTCSMNHVSNNELVQLSRRSYNDSARVQLANSLQRGVSLFHPPKSIEKHIKNRSSSSSVVKYYLRRKAHVWSAAIAKYIFRPHPRIQHLFHETYERLLYDGTGSLGGIHIRRGEIESNRMRYNSKPVFTTQKYIDTSKVLKGVRQFSPSQVYIATDSIDVYRELIGNSPDAGTQHVEQDTDACYDTQTSAYHHISSAHIIHDGKDNRLNQESDVGSSHTPSSLTVHGAVTQQLQQHHKPKQKADLHYAVMLNNSERYRSRFGTHMVALDGLCRLPLTSLAAPSEPRATSAANQHAPPLECALQYKDMLAYLVSDAIEASEPVSHRQLRMLLEALEDLYILSQGDYLIGHGSSSFSAFAALLLWARTGAADISNHTVLFLDQASVDSGLAPSAFLRGDDILNGTYGLSPDFEDSAAERWALHTKLFINGIPNLAFRTVKLPYDPWAAENRMRIVNGLPQLPEKVFYREARTWLGLEDGSRSSTSPQRYSSVWPGACPGNPLLLAGGSRAQQSLRKSNQRQRSRGSSSETATKAERLKRAKGTRGKRRTRMNRLYDDSSEAIPSGVGDVDKSGKEGMIGREGEQGEDNLALFDSVNDLETDEHESEPFPTADELIEYLTLAGNLGVDHHDRSHPGQAAQCWSDGLDVARWARDKLRRGEKFPAGKRVVDDSSLQEMESICEGNLEAVVTRRYLQYAIQRINSGHDADSLTTNYRRQHGKNEDGYDENDVLHTGIEHQKSRQKQNNNQKKGSKPHNSQPANRVSPDTLRVKPPSYVHANAPEVTFDMAGLMVIQSMNDEIATLEAQAQRKRDERSRLLALHKSQYDATAVSTDDGGRVSLADGPSSSPSFYFSEGIFQCHSSLSTSSIPQPVASAASGTSVSAASGSVIPSRELSPLPMWSWAFSRLCCDIYPSKVYLNSTGEWGLEDDLHYFLRRGIKNGSTVYVFINDFPLFLQKFAALPTSYRVTVVAGMGDYGVPTEVMSPHSGRLLSAIPLAVSLTHFLSDPRLVRLYAQNYDLVGCSAVAQVCSSLSSQQETLLREKVHPLAIGVDFHTFAGRDMDDKAFQLKVCNQRALLDEILMRESMPFLQRRVAVVSSFACDFTDTSDSYRTLGRRELCNWISSNTNNSNNNTTTTTNNHGVTHRKSKSGYRLTETITGEESMGVEQQTTVVPAVQPGEAGRELFWRSLATHAFALAPFGKGLDTHRVWEILQLRAVPIVLSSPLDRVFDGYPVVVVSAWSEVFAPGSLARFREEIMLRFGSEPFSTEVLERLTMRHWVRTVRNIT